MHKEISPRYASENLIGLGRVPIGIGAVLKGWDILEKRFRDPTRLQIVDFRAMTSACPHECLHCFTDKQQRTLSLGEIKSVIGQIAVMKARSIDFLGEGEPTIDPNLLEILSYTSQLGIQPIVFTDGATRMRDVDFVKKVKATGASVVLKGDSFFDPDYQNWIVGDKTGKYFYQRNQALAVLMEEGFNESNRDGTTRLGFVMVLSSRNIKDVERTLRFARERNIWPLFNHFLPAGRSARSDFDQSLVPTPEERERVRRTVQRIDAEYGFNHPMWNNFPGTPCMELVQIYGDGRVSACDGNEKVVGNVKTDSIKDLHERILARFPTHSTKTFNGNCPYRPMV